ncbi:MAG: serine/threonine-protein kinase [Pseudomonadota bacterium]
MTAPEGRRYQVQKILGRGGFGTVYEAEMLSTGGFSKAVALKVLNREMDNVEGVAQRLRDEARLLGRLKHPAIVRVDDLVRLDGRWTVVMELLTGANLHQVLREVGPLPLGVAMEIAQIVAGALHSAHDRPGIEGRPMGVLHRDIKPSNIQITPLGEVKVLDFGVARASFGGRESQTRSLIFGSVGYMAPERLAGRDSHAGDVYSLGVVIYELLAGRRLGTACSHPRLQATMVEEALDELAKQHPDPDLRQLLSSALAFNPDDRPRARAFQRLARAVRARNLDPWLSDWSEEVMLQVMPSVKSDAGHLTGHVLVETDQTRDGIWDSDTEDESGEVVAVPTPTPIDMPAGPPTHHSQPVPEEREPSDPLGLPPLPVRGGIGAPLPIAAAEAAPEDETLRMSPGLAERAILVPDGPGDPTRFERVTHASELTPSSSTTLVEAAGTQALPGGQRGGPEGERTSIFKAKVRWPIAVGVGLGASVLVVLLGAGLLSGAWNLPAEEAAQPAVTAPVPAAEPAPPAVEVDLPAEPVVEPVVPPEPAPVRRNPTPRSAPMAISEPAAVPAPAPVPAPDEPAAESPTLWGPMPAATIPPPAGSALASPTAGGPASPATVVVSGDARAVTLLGLAGGFGPGPVPPGHYTVMASFVEGEPAKSTMALDLRPGQQVVIDCRSGFDQCRALGEE